MFGREVFESVKRIQAELPERAGDHRCDSEPDRSRSGSAPASRRGLVEGHRPPRGHARGEPPDPRDDRAPGRGTRGRRLARRRQGHHRARCRDHPIRGPGPGAHRRRRTDLRIAMSVRLRRLAIASSCARPKFSTASCSRGRDHRPGQPDRRQPDRPERANLQASGTPSAYRFMVGDNSEVGIRW